MTFDRTFRAGQHNLAAVRAMLPRAGLIALVFVEPKRTLRENGYATAIGFPALIVPDHVDDPAAFAAAVTVALNRADLVDDLVGELGRMVEHFGAFAEDHSAHASTETWAALHCAREVLGRFAAIEARTPCVGGER